MENTEKTFRIGPIRPPSEANSLLLQITRGCTWNRCKFCGLYKRDTFQAYSVESIKKDIDVIAYYAALAEKYRLTDGGLEQAGLSREAGALSQEEASCFYLVYNWLLRGGKNVFLQDGNSLALKPERVAEVLCYLRSKFPKIKRITTYARAETLSKITPEEYETLRAAGLDRIHSGFESGSDNVLTLINKGVTAEQEIRAGKNIKAAGIEFSVYFMPGIGGKTLSRENALETARVVREIDPDFVRIRSAVIVKRSPLWEDLQEGRFVLCGENDKLKEIRLLIENTKECTGTLASDHIINLLQEVGGRLDKDHEKMLAQIDTYFALPVFEQKLFQLARRRGMVFVPADLSRIPTSYLRELEEVSRSIPEEEEWNELMNSLLMGFI